MTSHLQSFETELLDARGLSLSQTAPLTAAIGGWYWVRFRRSTKLVSALELAYSGSESDKRYAQTVPHT